MKLRVMGRYEECAAFAAIIRDNVPARYLRSISDWYPNRGITTEGRVYIEFDDPTYYTDLQPYPLNVLPEKKRR